MRLRPGILGQMESGIRLGDRVVRIGYFANTGSDELFTAPLASFRRWEAETEPLIPVITGSGFVTGRQYLGD